MTEEINVIPEKKKIVKPNKKFSKITAFSLIAITFVFCLFLIYFLSENFIKNNSDNRMIAQVAYDKKQVNKKPNDPALRVQLGFTYFMNGDDSDALEQFSKALSLDKNYYPAYLNMAILYDSQDKNNKALVNASKASELAPKDYRALVLKGRAYRKLKIYDKASIALEAAIELNPGNVDTMYEIGYLAEVQGDYNAANEIYKDALNYNPIYKPALKGIERMKEKIKK
jgi:Tfp pilus assembly protein PilF